MSLGIKFQVVFGCSFGQKDTEIDYIGSNVKLKFSKRFGLRATEKDVKRRLKKEIYQIAEKFHIAEFQLRCDEKYYFYTSFLLETVIEANIKVQEATYYFDKHVLLNLTEQDFQRMYDTTSKSLIIDFKDTAAGFATRNLGSNLEALVKRMKNENTLKTLTIRFKHISPFKYKFIKKGQDIIAQYYTIDGASDIWFFKHFGKLLKVVERIGKHPEKKTLFAISRLTSKTMVLRINLPRIGYPNANFRNIEFDSSIRLFKMNYVLLSRSFKLGYTKMPKKYQRSLIASMIYNIDPFTDSKGISWFLLRQIPISTQRQFAALLYAGKAKHKTSLGRIQNRFQVLYSVSPSAQDLDFIQYLDNYCQ